MTDHSTRGGRGGRRDGVVTDRHTAASRTGRDLVRDVWSSLREALPAIVLFALQRLLALIWATVLVGGPKEILPALVKWDGEWYAGIARYGYDPWPTYDMMGSLAHNNLAFFPFLPFMGRAAAAVLPIEPSTAVVGMAWVGGLFAAWGIYALGRAVLGPLVEVMLTARTVAPEATGRGHWAGIALVLIWGCSPSGLVMIMGYPEVWLTAAIAFTLLFIVREKPIAAGVSCMFAGTMQPGAVPLVGTTGLWLLWLLWRRARGATTIPWRYLVIALVLAAVGFGSMLVFTSLRTGELLGYFAVQRSWDNGLGSPTEFLQLANDYLYGKRAGNGQKPPPAVYIPVIVGYLALFALVWGLLRRSNARYMGWLLCYTTVAVALTVCSQTAFHVLPRHFLPVITLLLPLATIRTSRAGAIAALGLASVVSAAWGANLLAHLNYYI